MKIFIKVSVNFFVSAAVFCLSCCSAIEDVPMSAAPDELVTVNVDVGASPAVLPVCTKSSVPEMDGEDAIVCDMNPCMTKSVDDPDDASSTVIKNLWVIQYDGTGDSAVLSGVPSYIEDYADPANRSVQLVASSSVNTVVFLANTFDSSLPFPQGSTIGDLKDRRFTINSLADVVPSGQLFGSGDFPDGDTFYQRLNGSVEQVIQEGGSLSCELSHNAARINLSVTNLTQGTSKPVRLVSADLVNVPGCEYFFTDYDGYSSGTSVGRPTSTDIGLYGLDTYDDVVTWSASESVSAVAKTAHLFVPANESGVISGTVVRNKPLSAPSRALAVRINGEYQDGGDWLPVTYMFPVGANMYDNYQVVPNGQYDLDIILNARGNKKSDGRVSYAPESGEDYTVTDDWPLSNCYICNPPGIATRSNVYRIPVRRVDQFWGGGSYESVEDNCLLSGRSWTVEVLWSDFPVSSDNFVITKDSGTGRDDFFEVSVPGTSAMGNVVIGITNSVSSDILWSWHIWVTDYCPDDASGLSSRGAFIAGTDTYSVTGGAVQRYDSDKVFMDRTIGARSTDYVGCGTGMLYYQFGRKDPFPGNGTYYRDGTVLETFVLDKVVSDATDVSVQPANVPYSVTHPETFITGITSHWWTYGDRYNPLTYVSSIIWQDPSASLYGGKSLFDPSPSGWKVPETIRLTHYSDGVNMEYANTSYALGSVQILLSGCRFTTGGMGNAGSGGYLWRSLPSSTTFGYSLSCRSGIFYRDNAFGRSSGFPVRPVRE